LAGFWEWIKQFQFPLHRDPRCNSGYAVGISQRAARFSSLYIGILAATLSKKNGIEYMKSFSSLYIGILAATILAAVTAPEAICFSSLYIGILAATCDNFTKTYTE